MDNISNTVWQRKGSSIVFGKDSLRPFVSSKAVITLKQALEWLNCMPSEPPVQGHTIMVIGLETIIEVMSVEAAEKFLIHQIRPLIIEVQNRWPNCGIVFCFSKHENAFEEAHLEDEVNYRRGDQQIVRLSTSLWDGSASVNMKRIISESTIPGKETTVGYYVARLS